MNNWILVITATDAWLTKAAEELETYLEQITGEAWTIYYEDQEGEAIRLEVDAEAPEFAGRTDEALRIQSSNGFLLKGKSSLAARHAAYIFLEKLGVRWFFNHPTWEVVPPSLVDLGPLDEIHEPAFIWRRIWAPDIRSPSDTAKWRMRNRLYGAMSYLVWDNGSSYLPKELYVPPPPEDDRFLPNPMYPEGIKYPWQPAPDNAEVISRAITYAEGVLGAAPSPVDTGCGDNLYSMVASVSPNDGTGWDPPYGTDWQTITNLTFGLTSAVAAAIQATYPSKYAGKYCVSYHGAVPDGALDAHMYVEVCTAFNVTTLKYYQKVEGILGKGVLTGIYDFNDVWDWWYEKPGERLSLIQRLCWLTYLGVKGFTSESSDGWGPRGLTYYLMSKAFWNPTYSGIVAVLNDFYDKAFGAAKTQMRSYYWYLLNRLPSVSVTEDELYELFHHLNNAQNLVPGNEAILERIRHCQYYMRWVWFRHLRGLADLSNQELEDFYTFVTKLRDLYVLPYGPILKYVEAELRNALYGRGYSQAQVDALQDFTPPTPEEAAAWLAEAIATLTHSDPPPIPTINPYAISLEALGDIVKPALDPLYGRGRNILIASEGNENVSVLYKGLQGTFQWFDPTQLMIDAFSFTEEAVDWTEVIFHAVLPGIYTLHVTLNTPQISRVSVQIPNRGAACIADPATKTMPESEYMASNSPRIELTNSVYFYVPSDTSAFTLTIQSWGVTVVKLIDGEGNTVIDISDLPSDPTYPEWQFDNPASGLWKLSVTALPNYFPTFWFVGIPPLVWHDAEYLLTKQEAAALTGRAALLVG